MQARATAALLARLAARHCAGSVHAHSTEERRASAAPIRPKASKKQLLAVVNGTRRPHTMNMTSAAKSKRASPVGVAGWTAEHGGMLDVQRFAPLRPRPHRAPAMPAPGNRFAKPMYLSRSNASSDGRRVWIRAPAHSARVHESGCALVAMPRAAVRGTPSSRDARPNHLSRRSASQTCNKPSRRLISE